MCVISRQVVHFESGRVKDGVGSRSRVMKASYAFESGRSWHNLWLGINVQSMGLEFLELGNHSLAMFEDTSQAILAKIIRPYYFGNMYFLHCQHRA